MNDSAPHLDEALAPWWSRGVLLGCLYFLSGTVALAYEVSWNRQIGLFFGHSANSAAIVLGAYFAGLGLGYYLGGLWSRTGSPLKKYGLAELFAAVWAILIPRILDLIETPNLLGALSSTNPALQTALRGAFCFVLLLPATVALGTTLPLMAESLRNRTRDLTGWAAICYGLNTLGAFLGVAITSLYLLLAVGVRGSGDLAALVGAAIGLVAIRAGRSTDPDANSEFTPSKIASRDTNSARLKLGVLVISFLSGFGLLALEVLYTRLFSLVFHNSSYTFGEVIAAFLLALGFAALLVPFVSRRVRPENLLIVSSWVGSLAIGISILVFIKQTGLDYFSLTGDAQSYLAESFLLTFCVVFPPVVILGTILPALWKSLDATTLSGTILGKITMINSLAAALGAISASFCLLPLLGLWRSFAFVACLFLGLAVWLSLRQHRRIGGTILALTGIPVLGLLWMGNSYWIQPESSREELLKRWESAYGWIDVVRDKRSGSLKVRQNLHYRHGSTGLNEDRERRQAHIPLLLHQKPKDVLFLGLGTGMTAAGALEHDNIEQITIVELIPEVVEAARMLGESNQEVIDDPKVTVRIDDARHWMLATDEKYDVIVADLFVPWESQTGYLYTVENFRTARSRLRPGGIFCQWLPLYQLGPGEFEPIADSFADSFPETTLWWGLLSRSKPMLALVGSETPLGLNPHELQPRIDRLFSGDEVTDDHLDSAEHLLELALGRWPQKQNVLLNTDEHPRVEFLAPLSHLDRRMLSRGNLERYFDRVLVNLPPVIESAETTENRQAQKQRVSLFGE